MRKPFQKNFLASLSYASRVEYQPCSTQRHAHGKATMMDFDEAKNKAVAFRDERDWAQFHNPKDLAISISLEAAELLEAFQWSGSDVDRPSNRECMEDELADILIYCIYLADRLNCDIPDIISSKIDSDKLKYPIDKARGNARKYTNL